MLGAPGKAHVLVQAGEEVWRHCVEAGFGGSSAYKSRARSGVARLRTAPGLGEMLCNSKVYCYLWDDCRCNDGVMVRATTSVQVEMRGNRRTKQDQSDVFVSMQWRGNGRNGKQACARAYAAALVAGR